MIWIIERSQHLHKKSLCMWLVVIFLSFFLFLFLFLFFLKWHSSSKKCNSSSILCLILRGPTPRSSNSMRRRSSDSEENSRSDRAHPSKHLVVHFLSLSFFLSSSSHLPSSSSSSTSQPWCWTGLWWWCSASGGLSEWPKQEAEDRWWEYDSLDLGKDCPEVL